MRKYIIMFSLFGLLCLPIWLLYVPGHTQGGIILNNSFEGISGDAKVYVPDPTLGVGPNSIILVTNGPLEIRTKMGAVVASTLLETFFSSVQSSNEGAYDPQVVFDPDSERFFLAATGFVRDSLCDPGDCVSNIFLAVSKTSNPTTFDSTDWYFYVSDASLIGGTPTANWADRPRLGVNKNIVVIAFPLFRASDGEFMGETVRIFEKSKLIDGQNVAGTDFHGMNVEGNLARTMQPALHFGDTDVFFLLSHGGGPTWSCETVWGISNALSSPTLSYVPFSSFNEGCTIPPDAAQPGGGMPLDTGGNALQDGVVYRNGSLWTARTLGRDFGSGDVSAIRWIEIDVSDWPNSAERTQDAIFGVDGTWLFFPAITVDAENNMAMVYAQSSTTEYASVYYTGRLATDPPNTMRPGQLLKAGSAVANYVDGTGRNRFGDFFGIDIDPTDGTIWFVGEYAKEPTVWGTWVGNVEFVPTSFAEFSSYLPVITN